MVSSGEGVLGLVDYEPLEITHRGCRAGVAFYGIRKIAGIDPFRC